MLEDVSTVNSRSLGLSPWESRAGAICFALLFPGFFLYNAAVLHGYVPQIITGGFGEASIIAALFAVGLALKRGGAIVSAAPYVSVLLVFLIGYIVLWSLAHVFFAPSPGILAAAVQVARTVVLWVALMFVGFVIVHIMDASARFFIALAVAVLAPLVFWALASGATTLYSSGYYPIQTSDLTVAAYQQIGRSVLVSSIVALSIRSVPVPGRLAILSATLFTLAFVGARSELLAGLVVGSILLVMWSLRESKVLALATMFVVGVFFMTAYGYVDLTGMVEANPRIASFLALEDDASFISRAQLADVGLQRIAQSPLFGQFGAHVTSDMGTGSYRHDALSAWEAFGAMGFVLYSSAVLGAFFVALMHGQRVRQLESTWTLVLLLTLVSVLLSATTKSVWWPLPALGWGALLGARHVDWRSSECSRRGRLVKRCATAHRFRVSP